MLIVLVVAVLGAVGLVFILGILMGRWLAP
jgi:hypothetical protein